MVDMPVGKGCMEMPVCMGLIGCVAEDVVLESGSKDIRSLLAVGRELMLDKVVLVWPNGFLSNVPVGCVPITEDNGFTLVETEANGSMVAPVPVKKLRSVIESC